MSLRERLHTMGIDGIACEEWIAVYHRLTLDDPGVRMNKFLGWVREIV